MGRDRLYRGLKGGFGPRGVIRGGMGMRCRNFSRGFSLGRHEGGVMGERLGRFGGRGCGGWEIEQLDILRDTQAGRIATLGAFVEKRAVAGRWPSGRCPDACTLRRSLVFSRGLRSFQSFSGSSADSPSRGVFPAAVGRRFAGGQEAGRLPHVTGKSKQREKACCSSIKSGTPGPRT